jgi:multidrug efflux pump subunit AcrB
MTLSVVVAIILTPALCATMLKPLKEGHGEGRKGFFGLFNRAYDASSRVYQSTVRRLVFRVGRVLVLYAVQVAALVLVFPRLPSDFLPRGPGHRVRHDPTCLRRQQERNREGARPGGHYFLEDEKPR